MSVNENQVLKKNRKGTEYIEANGEIIAKRCSGCGEMKELEHFHHLKSGLAGRVSDCKVCRSKKKKIYIKTRAMEQKKERIKNLLNNNVPVGLKVTDFSSRGRRMYIDMDGNVYLDCTGCRKPVLIDEFYSVSATGFKGRHNICKQCSSAYGKQWYKENKEKHK